MITMPPAVARLTARQREQAEHQRKALGVDARSWYRITNAADGSDEAEVMLYDEIGGWWGANALDLIAELRQISTPRMRVRINSPGGSVFEGIAIANALRSHPAAVTVQIDGIAASIASVIAMAGDRIEMAPNTMLMIHDASGMCFGPASEMEEMAELLDLISDNIADAYAARAGGTREQWRARMQAETWYLPEDAVEAGLADEATQTPQQSQPQPEPEPGPDGEPEPEMRRRFDFAAYGYAGPDQPGPAQPGPPAADDRQPTLVVSIADLLDEDAVARLRAAVTPPAEPAAEEPPAAPEPEPTAAEEPVAEPATEPEPVAPAAKPEDEWAAAVAHLTQDDADNWSALVTHLIEPDTSSSAATA
jgi:ATP-dependent protease ClpP protease subunit